MLVDGHRVPTPEPYYSDDLVTLYHGDSREILPELSGVDLVFTSPPYNLGTCPTGTAGVRRSSIAARDFAGGYASYSDAMPQDEYDDWQRATVTALWGTLSERGAVFYNHKPRILRGIVTLPTTYGEGLPLRQVIVWDRGTGMNFSRSFFLPKCEWICVWAKPAFRLSSRSAGKVGDVWRIRPEHAADHPAPFPVELPTTAIEPTEAELILDPFAGSGTTLLAARNLGRRAVGIEMDERYCEIAARRVAEQQPMTLDFPAA